VLKVATTDRNAASTKAIATIRKITLIAFLETPALLYLREITSPLSARQKSALVRSREVPAASRISTTYRLAEGLRGGMLPVHSS
jgi:hypothetical protein